MTNPQFEKWLQEKFEEGTLTDQDHVQTEKDGEIVIHTGMYEWTDGTVHNTADPDFLCNGCDDCEND